MSGVVGVNDPVSNRTAMVSGGRRKVHTTFKSGAEMTEEYDLKTDNLMLRKVRKKTTLGGDGPWEVEVGDPGVQGMREGDLMVANPSSNPVFARKDTPSAFQWRVRNIPYPVDVYSVTVDSEKEQLVLRTSNKKYFKRFDIPDLKRAGIPLDDGAISFDHANNTLIISYNKPSAIINAEQEAKRERMKMSKEQGAGKEGDVECNTQ